MDPRSAPVRDRTDRCPGVLMLHPAADGSLARVRLPGGRISSAGLRAVADVASWGNGLVELTSRCSLQVRGLDADAGERVASRLAAGGLLASLPHDRVRNILASPVAGRAAGSVVLTDDIVAALDRGLCADPALANLPGRFLFAVDDGGGLLGGANADIALVAEAGSGPPRRTAILGARAVEDRVCAPGSPPRTAPAAAAPLRLWLAGERTTLTATAVDAPSLALDAARAFLTARGDEDDAAWRIADLADGPGTIARQLGGEVEPVHEELADGSRQRAHEAGSDDEPVREELASGSRQRARQAASGDEPEGPGLALAVGRLEQSDGRVAITVLAPLGRVDGATLRRLADLAGEVRLSMSRTLTIVDVPAADASGLAGTLVGLGFVTAPGSGWVGLSACAGLGACANARVDVRAAAAARARIRAPGAPAEHWSACERGCGRPPGVPVAVTATAIAIAIAIEMTPGHRPSAADSWTTAPAPANRPAPPSTSVRRPSIAARFAGDIGGALALLEGDRP
jgi:precorrin-3B synthase